MADNTILYGKWYFNDVIDDESCPTTEVNFNFVRLETYYEGNKIGLYSNGVFTYYLTDGYFFPYANGKWDNEGFRIIVITSGGSDNFLTWLQANATKVSDVLDIDSLKTNKMVFEEKMANLCDKINNKAGTSGAKTIDEMTETVEGIVIPEEPSGTIIVNSNGKHNVKDYEFAEVNVSSGVVPSGTLTVNKNGSYDVTEYANVSVATPVAEGETRSLKKLLDLCKSCAYMFYFGFNGNNVTDLTGFFEFGDTSEVIDMRQMFRGIYTTTIPQIDTAKVTNMEGMFQYCYKLTTLPALNTSKVTNMTQMFDGCYELITITELDMISISNRNYVSSMFNECKKLTNLTLYNIKINLTIGSGSTYGHLLTIESLLNTCQECINVNASRTLTVGSANITKLSEVYVKLTNEPEVDSTLPKLPMVQCESTDEGAMLVADYMALKQWSLA